MYQDNRYKVYRLTNHSLGEIYVGVTKNVESRIAKHAGYYAGGAKSIAHWDFDSDDIGRYTYPYRFNKKTKASEVAHYVEANCDIPSEYEIFLTRGI